MKFEGRQPGKTESFGSGIAFTLVKGFSLTHYNQCDHAHGSQIAACPHRTLLTDNGGYPCIKHVNKHSGHFQTHS